MTNANQIAAAVITVSDTRTLETDSSGDALCELLAMAGIEVVERVLVKDEKEPIMEQMNRLARRDEIGLIVTTGGTGVSSRDVTPEATREVIETEIPGIAEAMRQRTADKTKTSILSRGLAGVKNGTLIINLPGSTKGVRECFEVIAPILHHAVAQIRGEADH